MKKSKRFLLQFFVMIAVGMSVIPIINIVADPTGVFHFGTKLIQNDKPGKRPTQGDYLRPNFCIERVQYVLDHDFDSFVFGSSRASAIDLQQFHRRHIDGKWYRLNYPGGTFDQHYSHLKVLLERGKTVKNVIVAIDDFSFSVGPADVVKNIYTMPYYPGIDGFIKTWAFYLFRKPTEVDLEILTGRYLRVPLENPGMDEGINDWEKGTWPSRSFEKIWKSDAHRNSLAGSSGLDIGAGQFQYANAQIEYAKKLIMLCRENHIRLRLILNPIWYKTYLIGDFDTFNKYLKKVVALMSVTDFSGIHKYSTDNSYWSEPLHFSPFLGDRIIETLGSGREDGVFGRKITIDNFDKIIAAKKAAAESFISQKMDNCATIHPCFTCKKQNPSLKQ